MSEPDTGQAPEPADSAPSGLDGPAPAAQWAAPTYDVHPPAESAPTGPDGPSHFGGSASASAAGRGPDETSALPVVDDGSPLVWPELRGTPLIGRFVPLAEEPTSAPNPIAPTPIAPTPIAPAPVAPIPIAPSPIAPVPIPSTPIAPASAPAPVAPAPVDPPTAVIDLVKPAPPPPALIEPAPDDPAPVDEPAIEPAPIDIEPIVAVLVPPVPSALEQMDPPTEVVEVIQTDLPPEPTAALIVALQMFPPTTAGYPPQAVAPLALAPPAGHAQAYSPPQAPAPMWAPPVQRSRATQSVTCPECGTVVPVDPQARSSLDFCPNPVCDFPLFWVRSAVVADPTSYGEGASHRRLPGTAGRAIAASMACPHCTEPNPISGVLCVRCGLDLRPVIVMATPPPPPLPEPVYIAQEIEEPINWWLIILVGALIVLFFAALAFIAVAYLVD